MPGARPFKKITGGEMESMEIYKARSGLSQRASRARDKSISPGQPCSAHVKVDRDSGLSPGADCLSHITCFRRAGHVSIDSLLEILF